MREIDELLDLCRYAGSGPDIAQGAGGNVSVKSPDGSMWIKASGYRLSAVRPGVGYLGMRTPKASDLAHSVQGLEPAAANISMSSFLQSLVFDSTNLRPSLETWFHAVLGRVVLHTHPIYANAFACMEGGREALESVLPSPVASVEYEAPGHRLGEAVGRAAVSFSRQEGREPVRLILDNHGLITVADTVTSAIARSAEILDAGRQFFGPLPKGSFAPAIHRPHLERYAEDFSRELAEAGLPYVARPARFERLHRAAQDPDTQFSPIVPDDVVCNGPAILTADDSQPIRKAAAILAEGVGFIFVAGSEAMIQAMEEQLVANVLTRELIARRGVCRSLKQSDIAELLAMESEKHRQQVLASGGNQCRS